MTEDSLGSWFGKKLKATLIRLSCMAFTVGDLTDTCVACEEGLPEIGQHQLCMMVEYYLGLNHTDCVFSWERIPLVSHGIRVPLDKCDDCREVPSYHCDLCCPVNLVGN